MNQPTYNLRNLRKLLTTAFSDAELRQLCYDVPEFRPVFEQFSDGMSKDQVVQRLLEYCERKVLMKQLLGIMAEEVPKELYQQYAAGLGGDPNQSQSVSPSPEPITPAEAEHLKKLIELKTRVLHELQLQEAAFGLAVLPHVKIQIEDLKKELDELNQKLRVLR